MWFDGYSGQKTLILDDFSGDFCNYRFLLRLLDCYKMKIEVKGGHAWAVWTTVVITTNVHPSGWYPHVDTTPLQRRIKEIRMSTEKGYYQLFDWNERSLGDLIAYTADPVPSTSAPVPPAESPCTQPQSQVQRKRLHRQPAVFLEVQKEKEKVKECEVVMGSDDEITDPDL